MYCDAVTSEKIMLLSYSTDDMRSPRSVVIREVNDFSSGKKVFPLFYKLASVIASYSEPLRGAVTIIFLQNIG